MGDAISSGTVRVVFTKWDGRLHWHFTLDRLGEDTHGLWLAGRPGTALQRGHEPPRTEVDGFVMLAPRAGSWLAFWNVTDDPEVYVDVTGPLRVDTGSVTTVDLDLDVVRRRDGAVEILDEDEFEEHCVLFGYPAPVVEEARATARALLAALTQRAEPFDAAGPAWLSRLDGRAR